MPPKIIYLFGSFACLKACHFLCLEIYIVHLPSASSLRSVLLLAQKKRTKEKGSLKSFLGLTFYRLPTHYNSLHRILGVAQTVMLTYALHLATSKMLIYFQKRFDGIDRLTAIWVKIFLSMEIRVLQMGFKWPQRILG